jgi:AdoMet dependent proline di-methyltransferase
VWLQWTLQYLTDADVVCTLVNIGKVLTAKNGILVVKENRPFGNARSDRFQMETPSFSGRYDITRTDAQHRLLFQRAGLRVDMAEEGEETNTYAMSCY